MAISVTDLGLVTSSSGAAIVLSSISVPAGSCIAVVTGENTGTGVTLGTLSDSSSSNVYTNAVSGSNAGGSTGGGVSALWILPSNPTTVTSITYTKNISGVRALLAAFYATGLDSVEPIDTVVTAHAVGSGASPTVTSGTPVVSGELFAAFVYAGAGTSSNFVQDTGNGWAAPFDSTVTLTRCYGGGGNQVNSGTSTLTFAPTLVNTASWITFVIGLRTPFSLSNVECDGAGSLSATARLALAAFAQFSGAGSLSAATIQVANISESLAGAGNLSAYLALNTSISASFGGAGSLSVNGVDQSSLAPRSPFYVLGTAEPPLWQPVFTKNLSLRAPTLVGTASFAGSSSLSVNATIPLFNPLLIPPFYVPNAGDLAFWSWRPVTNLAVLTTSNLIFAGAGSLSALITQNMLESGNQFAGAGSLSATTTLQLAASASFNGAGNLTVNGVPSGHVFIPGTSTLSVTATLNLAAFETLAGASSLSVSMTAGLAASAVFNGAGSLFVISVQSGLINFNGAGSLSASVTSSLGAFANFGGAGGLSVNASTINLNFSRAPFYVTSLVDTASLWTWMPVRNLSAILGKDQALSTVFAGSGNLAVSATFGHSISAIFAGVGSLSIGIVAGLGVNAEFDGAGSLSVSFAQAWAASAIFNGAGSLSVNAIQSFSSPHAEFDGAGRLSVSVSLAIAGLAAFSGSGSLSVLTIQSAHIFATFKGASQLLVSTAQHTANANLFAGAGSLSIMFTSPALGVQAMFTGMGGLCVQAFLRKGPRGVTQNRVVAGPGVAQNVIIPGSTGPQPPPPTSNWILQSGFWNDNGVWIDTSTWID